MGLREAFVDRSAIEMRSDCAGDACDARVCAQRLTSRRTAFSGDINLLTGE
ncbi:hypothetical protein PSAC2689_20202 [Paraburkholderia sacchari]